MFERNVKSTSRGDCKSKQYSPTSTGFFYVLFYLYMLEGIPYGLQSRFLPLVLRSRGLSLTTLGFYKLLYIPWLFKGFYAPLVETIFTKRFWLVWSLVFLFSVTATLAMFFNSYFPTTSNTASTPLIYLGLCLFLYNLSAATQDIAVDGLALSFLSASQLGVGNTIQVVGYKVGAIFGGGFLAALSTHFSTAYLLNMIAFVYFVGIVVCSFGHLFNDSQREYATEFSAPECSRPRATGNSKDANPKEQLLPFPLQLIPLVSSRKSRALLTLLLVYKLGEQGAMNMLPLMLLDRGASVGQVGMWCATLGQLCSIAGSTFGLTFRTKNLSIAQLLHRLMITRFALHFPLILASMYSRDSILYFGFSALSMNLYLFVSGAITTVMFTLMMQCTKCEASPHRQATHYSILSTGEILGKLVFGVLASSFTEISGYPIANLVFSGLSGAAVYTNHIFRNDLAFE